MYLGVVPKREDWLAVVDALRADGDPLRSPALPELYNLAVRDGETLLRRMFPTIGEADRTDHIHDVLARSLTAIIGADEPRALFIVCLRNHMLSYLRVFSHHERPTESGVVDARADGELDAVARLDRARAARVLEKKLAAMVDGNGPRDAAIFVALLHGEEPAVIATTFRVSVVNVYKIQERVLKRLRAAEEDES